MSFLKSLIVLAAVFGTSPGRSADILFIGTAGDGIYACRFEDGKLATPEKIFPLHSNSEIESGPKGRYLFVSAATKNKGGTGELISLRLANDSSVEEINRLPSGVDHFCSMAVNRDGHWVLGTSFGQGVVSSFTIKANGTLSGPASRIELPRVSKDGRAMSRAHDVEVTKNGKLAFVTDLFANRVYSFNLNPETGELTQSGFTTSAAFMGPRHLILFGDESLVYVLNQKGSSVVAFRHDGSGGLTEFQSISTLPPDYRGPQNHSAEILIHPSEKYLYISNRIHDSLVVFAIKPDGFLEKVQSISSGGQSPWSFVFDPSGDYLICSNLKSNNLVVCQIDHANGKLSRKPGEITVPGPKSLSF